VSGAGSDRTVSGPPAAPDLAAAAVEEGKKDHATKRNALPAHPRARGGEEAGRRRAQPTPGAARKLSAQMPIMICRQCCPAPCPEARAIRHNRSGLWQTQMSTPQARLLLESRLSPKPPPQADKQVLKTQVVEVTTAGSARQLPAFPVRKKCWEERCQRQPAQVEQHGLPRAL
jgi:hypothetical protein